MEPESLVRTRLRGDNCLAPLMVMKTFLFAAVTVFVLCLPMGDPFRSYNIPDISYAQELAICRLCDIYYFFVRTGNKLCEISQMLWCKLLEVLYEMKLNVYNFLYKIDKKDLCAVCQRMDKQQEFGRCKCTRNKCRRCQ